MKTTKDLYFDWAATAPVDEDICREATEVALTYYGNPSSEHLQGSESKKILEEARERCATTLGVNAGTLYFTSGGTESDHIPLLALLQRPAPGTVIISAIEHPAIREQAHMLKHQGWKVLEAKPNSQGIVSPQTIENLLTDDTVLVCLMAVNNEIGTLQPIYQVANMLKDKVKITGKRRVKLHVDCVQAAGKVPLCLNYPGIDSAAFSAHKIGGPRGIGLLYLAQKQEVYVRGGGQEGGIRSGTENIAGAWALSRCLEKYYIAGEFSKNGTKNNDTASRFEIKKPTPIQSATYERYLRQQSYTADFINTLKNMGATLIPERTSEDFSPWIVQAAFKGLPGQVLVRALSEKGIAISTGSACSSRKISRPVLEAMGTDKELASRGVRFSFGFSTTKESMETLVQELKEITKLFS